MFVYGIENYALRYIVLRLCSSMYSIITSLSAYQRRELRAISVFFRTISSRGMTNLDDNQNKYCLYDLKHLSEQIARNVAESC